jgi:hypothetical protein
VVEVGFTVAKVENEHVTPWQERHVGSLLGVPWWDGYGGVVGRTGYRDRVVRRARHQWLLVEGPNRGERQLDSANRDAVVGDLEETVQARRSANKRGDVGAREGEVDPWGNQGFCGSRGDRRGGHQERLRHRGDAGLDKAADA